MSALDLGSVSVGPPYYAAVLTPLLLPFALLMGLGPSLPWKEAPWKPFLKKSGIPLAAGAAAGSWAAVMAPRDVLFAAAMMFAAGWIVAAMLAELARRTDMFRAWRKLQASTLGMTVAHIGFALVLAGATAATCWAAEKTLWMRPMDHTAVGAHEVLFLRVEPGIGDNYDFDRGVFSSPTGAEDFVFLYPERRWYPAAGRMMSQTALHAEGLGMLYVVLGDEDSASPGRWVVRLYYHPLILLLPLGAALIALGGCVAMFSPGFAAAVAAVLAGAKRQRAAA
jgi:cytochrome c-type biogenesis protein CcmF